MKAISKFCVLIFVLQFFVSMSFGQANVDFGSKEAVILYNGKPFLVKLAYDGEILEFVKKLPDSYLGNYQKEIDQLVAEYDNSSAGESENYSSIVSNPEPNYSAPDSGNQNQGNQSYVINEPISYVLTSNQNEFLFDYKTSVIKDDHFMVLNGVLAAYQQNQISGINIRPFQKDRSKVSQVLAKNRSDACRSYLMIKGVPSQNISVFETIIDPNSSAHIILETY